MANINITSDAWTEISITSGTVQNISATADIELSAEQTDNSGVVLKPSEIYQWDNETIYARAVTESAGALRVVNFKKAAGGGGYVLPVASASTLGGVKVGNNLSIDASGVLSATGGGSYVLPVATASELGGVKVGSNITIDANGAISAPAAYTLPTAAANTLGGIKVGNGLSIDASGVLSATGGGGAGEKTPVGTVIQFMGTAAPTNYLACDGTEYNIADYQTLADHIAAQFGAVDFFGGDGVDTFAVPDLRGEFLRGTGTNGHTNQGNGANVGVHQDGTEIPDIYLYDSTLYFDKTARRKIEKYDSQIASGGTRTWIATTNTQSTTDPAQAAIPRPTNTSVLYCIKYQ